MIKIEERKIYVDIPIGKLCAVVGGNPEEYPEIYVYIERNDGVEIDLVAAGYEKQEAEVCAYLYGDTSTEEWTKKYKWSAEEINIPCN